MSNQTFHDTITGQNTLTLRHAERKAGVSKTTVFHIEHGKVKDLKFRTVSRISDALGVKPEDVTEFAAVLEARRDG